ncbi:MAG: hypothetical protein KGJ34_01580 [Patescibacteria group bacterium]|nr:hypothetical protein [Patescibacteria group bacterium]
MFSLFGKKEEAATKTIAILDIGSGSVGCALILLDRKGPPSILAHTREEAHLESGRTGEKLQSTILASAKKALETIAKSAHKSPKGKDGYIEHLAIFLPAPWSTLFLRNIRLAREMPVHVTPALIEGMVADYVKRERPDENTEVVIERSAVGIRLNGYGVNDLPNDVSASTVELSIVSATSSKTFIGNLRDIARPILGGHVPLSFHSTPVAATYALSTLFPETPDYILCNSEGELTELLLVLEHTPSAAATSTAACNTILRTVSVHADMARAEANSALALARDARSPMSAKLEKTLASAQRECADGFRAAATELIASFSPPRTIYVIGEGQSAQWYAESLAHAPFLKSLFPLGVAVDNVQYSTLAKNIKQSGGSSDVFLALEAIYTDARFDERRTFNFRVEKGH